MFAGPAARVKGRWPDAQSSPNTGGDRGAAAGPSDAAKPPAPPAPRPAEGPHMAEPPTDRPAADADASPPKAADAIAEPRAAGRAAGSLELEAIPAPEPGE